MKKLSLILSMMIAAGSVMAEQKVPDYQVSVSTGSLTTITGLSSNRLSDVISWIDSNMVLSTNLASRPTTNWVVYAITNTYAPYFSTNYLAAPTNQTPKFIGQQYIIKNTIGVATSLVYQAFGVTTGSWQIIYQGQ